MNRRSRLQDALGTVAAPGRRTRTVRVAGKPRRLQATDLLWDSLDDICRREGLTLDDLATMVAGSAPGRLVPALELFATTYFVQATRKLPPPIQEGEDGA